MEYEPRSPNYKVSFSLEDADLAELVRVIGQLTGKRFIFGGKVKSIKASVYSPEKVTVAEAYQAFLSILEANGLTVVPHGPLLEESSRPQAQPHRTTQIYSGQTKFSAGGALHHAHPSPRARERGRSFQHPREVQVERGRHHRLRPRQHDHHHGHGHEHPPDDFPLLDEIDVGGAGDQNRRIEPIHYASASDVANRVNELFDLKGGSGAAPAAAGAPKGGAPVQGVGGSPTSDLHVAKIVSDDRSNSLVIVSTERAYLRILELIKRLDVPQTGEGEIHVLPLQHADATEFTKTLNEIITGSATAGAAPAPAGGARPAGPGGGGGAAGAPGGVFEGGLKVSADRATNSIVVTSSLRDYASLRAVIDKLGSGRVVRSSSRP